MKNLIRTVKLFARGEVHLHLALTTLFVLLLIASSATALAYTYVQTSDAALTSAWQMMKTTNRGIYRDVLRYLGTAKRTTTAVAWALADAQSVHDDEARIKPIVSGQIRASREVFSVSVGDTSGSVLMVGKTFDDPKYSVGKKKPLPPNVKYRSHHVDLLSVPKTDHYQYMNAEMVVVDEENVPTDSIKYDARTRPWFKEAATHKSNAWTDVTIYPSGEFGIANVEPVLNRDGSVKMVVSATIALSLQDGITSRLKVAKHGFALVLNEDGELIAHPDHDKITRCDAARQCRFNKVNEIGDPAVMAAYVHYKEKSNLKNPANWPKQLEFLDYSTAIERLEPPARKAFDSLYLLDSPHQRIVLRDNLTHTLRQTLPQVLSSIGYTYNVRFTSGKNEYLASFHGFPGRYGKPWLVATLVPIDDFIGDLKQTLTEVIVISLVILFVAIVIIVIASRRILRPLAQISTDMNRIQNLEIDETIKHSSFFYEIDTIGSALGSMKHGLKAFSKFVPVTLVKQLIATGTGAELSGEKRRLTMMFTDIEGFTTISESMKTEALLQHISEYLDHLTTIILGENGTVDKYIGDAIMSFWGAPISDPNHELHGCRAALLCVRRLETLNANWSKEGKPELRTRFGLSSGDVSVGNMGSRERMNYTVLGDAVNLASRLESINKYYGTRVIIGEDTFEAVKTHFLTRPVDVVAVKGKVKGVRIYELMAGLPGEPDIAPSEKEIICKQLTERAFKAYLSRDFGAAQSLYEQLAEAFPEDQLAQVFIERCREYQIEPPDADWTGVTRMTKK
jgi:class 3 adenylate cyclase